LHGRSVLLMYGHTQLQAAILDRYGMRCHWYNQEHLRSLVLDSKAVLSGIGKIFLLKMIVGRNSVVLGRV
jgi:hypothetical protein